MHDPIFIKDPITGDIKVSKEERLIIDDKNFQRLRYIKQLGLSYLSYPGANHTRFEHSIGVMHTTREICERLGMDDEELVIAGLLHDIGHTPFSHQVEHTILKYLKKSHEDIGIEIISKSSISDAISKSTLSLSRIKSYMRGKGKGDIICGPLGSDRIDYLMRDSHYTGTAYGVIDRERLTNKFIYRRGRLCIVPSGIRSAESMLIARYYMFLSVYQHHTTLIAGSMLVKAIESTIEEGEIDPNDLKYYNDSTLTTKLLNSETVAKRIMEQILDRRLFKRVVFRSIPYNRVVNINKINEIILNEGVDYNEFIAADIRTKGGDDEISIFDPAANMATKLSDSSQLFNALIDTMTKRRILLIAGSDVSNRRITKAISKLAYL